MLDNNTGAFGLHVSSLTQCEGALQDDRADVVLLQPQLPAAVAAAGRRLRKPSSPHKNLPEKWKRADVAFLKAVNFKEVTGYEVRRFLIPCADQLQAGRNIVVIGHTGGCSAWVAWQSCQTHCTSAAIFFLLNNLYSFL